METINLDEIKLQYLNGKYYIITPGYGNGIFNKILTDIDEREHKKENSNRIEFKLYENCPNPFDTVTDIQFGIPKSGFVKLSIYDIFGREIEILLAEFKLGGIYNIKFNGWNLMDGSYFLKLTCKCASEDLTDIRKMIISKKLLR